MVTLDGNREHRPGEVNTTPLTMSPNFASAHDGTITTIDSTTAEAPMAHQIRGHRYNEVAVSMKSMAFAKPRR